MNRVATGAVVMAIASVAACKKKASAGEAIDTMASYRSQMCACHDRACADRVQDGFMRWAQAESRRDPGGKLSEEEMRRVTDISAEYATCMTAATGGGGSAMPVPDQARMSDPDVTNADVAIKQLYDGLDKEHVVTHLDLSYIHADGTIDATYGRVDADLGRPKRPEPADDPNRPIGAPVPVDDHLTEDFMARCPEYTWKGGKRTTGETSCGMLVGESLARPKCSVRQLWKQAIDAGAPAAGLARLTLRGDGWSFVIDDAPRNIHFDQTFPDTCAPMVEAP